MIEADAFSLMQARVSAASLEIASPKVTFGNDCCFLLCVKEKRRVSVMVRLEDSEKLRLQAVADHLRSNPSVLAYQATMALVEAVEKHGRISSPLVFSADSFRETPAIMLNEPIPPLGYGLGRLPGETKADPRRSPLQKSGGDTGDRNRLSDTQPPSQKGEASA